MKLHGVHGLAVRGTRLYLATERELFEAEIPARGKTAATRRRLSDLPPAGRHPNRTLATGPDGRLYLTVGSTCNCCVEDDPESATVLQIDLATWDRRVFARGLRNTLGIDWHPVTGEMWGVDNGSDWLGDDVPPEELNRLEDGRDYGWPFVWGDRQTIPLREPPGGRRPRDLRGHHDAARPRRCRRTPPRCNSSSTTRSSSPRAYRDDAFVTLHGSWNRRPPDGYEVVRIVFDDRGRPERVEPFLTRLPQRRRQRDLRSSLRPGHRPRRLAPGRRSTPTASSCGCGTTRRTVGWPDPAMACHHSQVHSALTG